jgi:hypothetical protein
MTKAHLMTGGRYPVLRALGILYVVGAIVALVTGIYWIGWSLFAAPGSIGERIAVAGGFLAATFLAVVTVLAIAELIKLLIDIEHNTRISAITAASGHGSTAPTTAATAAVNRMVEMNEESAEAALLRGH